MKYYGKPTIEKIEHRLCEYIRCDSCNKKIKGKYFEITTGHNDWGNDSIDSIEHKDICDDCVNKYCDNYLKENQRSNTAYIDVEPEIFVANQKYYGDYDEFKDKLVEDDDLKAKEINNDRHI